MSDDHSDEVAVALLERPVSAQYARASSVRKEAHDRTHHVHRAPVRDVSSAIVAVEALAARGKALGIVLEAIVAVIVSLMVTKPNPLNGPAR